MKKLIIILVTLFFVSCQNKYEVYMENGSTVSVRDPFDRDFKSGDKVCIYNALARGYDWVIDNSNKMLDTSYIYSFKLPDSTTRTFFYEYHVGFIK